MSVRADLEIAFETRKSWLHRWVTPITVSGILLALTTGFIWMVDVPLQHDHLIFFYLVPTALIAIRYGSISAMCVAIISMATAAYFLYSPRFSFMVTSSLDMIEIVLFSLLALLASQVVSGFAQDSVVEKRRPRGSFWLRRLRSAVALWHRVIR